MPDRTAEQANARTDAALDLLSDLTAIMTSAELGTYESMVDQWTSTRYLHPSQKAALTRFVRVLIDRAREDQER